MKTLMRFFAVMSALGVSSPAADKTLIDYFLPAPIRAPLTKDVWGAPNVLPRDSQTEKRTQPGGCVPGKLTIRRELLLAVDSGFLQLLEE